MSPRTETVYFGSGGFWSRQPLFDQLHGVVSTRSGYMGGWGMHPTRDQVNSGMTGHTEVVEVVFDTNRTKFRTLLKAFFTFHDPCIAREAKGGQYRSIVFCRKAKQNIITERAIALLKDNGVEVVTRVKDAGLFWAANPDLQHHATEEEMRPAGMFREISLMDAVEPSFSIAAYG